MKKATCFLLLCLVSVANDLSAQKAKHATPAEKEKQSVVDVYSIFPRANSKPAHYLRINYENDLFTQTDYYYTQGILIETAFAGLERNPLNKAVPHLRFSDVDSYTMALHTEGFTPTSIKSDSILYGDRPYAGTIFLSFGRRSERYNAHLKAELRIGIIGPAALGYESQKFIHEHTNNPIPHGWQYQIANDLLIGYNLKWDHNFIKTRFFLTKILSEINAGTEYDNISIGAALHIPLAEERTSNPFRLSLNASINHEWVIYNATLQGGLFNSSSPYTISRKDIERKVNNATVGFTIGINRLTIECYDEWITREFVGGRQHAWGHIGILYNFK